MYLWITISHLFVYLPTLESTTFKQHVCSTKIGYANVQSLGTNICKKRNVATLNRSNQAKKQCNFDSGWMEQHSAIDIASSESCEPKSIFRYNNQISSTVTTRTWVLSKEWTRTWPSIGIRMTKWLPRAIWTHAYSESLYGSKRECFCVNNLQL